MSGRDEFIAAYRDVALKVHELLTDPAARERFRTMRQAWKLPPSGEYWTVTQGPPSLEDKYVWLGTVHDMCFPAEPVFPEDATDEPTEAWVVASLSKPWPTKEDTDRKRFDLEGFLVDVRADLKAVTARRKAEAETNRVTESPGPTPRKAGGTMRAEQADQRPSPKPFMTDEFLVQHLRKFAENIRQAKWENQIRFWTGGAMNLLIQAHDMGKLRLLSFFPWDEIKGSLPDTYQAWEHIVYPSVTASFRYHSAGHFDPKVVRKTDADRPTFPSVEEKAIAYAGALRVLSELATEEAKTAGKPDQTSGNSMSPAPDSSDRTPREAGGVMPKQQGRSQLGVIIPTPLSSLPQQEPERTYCALNWMIACYKVQVRQWEGYQMDPNPRDSDGYRAAFATCQVYLRELTKVLSLWCDAEKNGIDPAQLNVLSQGKEQGGNPGTAARSAIALADRIRVLAAHKFGLNPSAVLEPQGVVLDKEAQSFLMDYRRMWEVLYPSSTDKSGGGADGGGKAVGEATGQTGDGNPAGEPVLTIKEVVERLRLTKKTIRNWNADAKKDHDSHHRWREVLVVDEGARRWVVGYDAAQLRNWLLRSRPAVPEVLSGEAMEERLSPVVKKDGRRCLGCDKTPEGNEVFLVAEVTIQQGNPDSETEKYVYCRRCYEDLVASFRTLLLENCVNNPPWL